MMLAAAVLLAAAAPLTAQKKPKPALSEGNARRAVAAAPGFALKTGDVRVRSVSPAGELPVTVVAEVKTAVRFEKVEGEDAGAGGAGGEGGDGGGQGRNGDVGGQWRAVELRTADRNWEELDWLAAAVGAVRVEDARRVLAEMAGEFESRLRESGKAEEVERGAVRLKDFSALLSSATAVVTVEAAFRLERGADRKWRVTEVAVGDVPGVNLDRLLASVNEQKAARARSELEAIRAALEAFRRERGFYVVADGGAALGDHLSPRYLPRVLRLDPWQRPYRYGGTRERYTLSSDGADGKSGTPDDVTVGGR